MLIHRGEATFTQVRHFNKVGGKDIILAHRLLKNSIQSDEYILMTDSFVDTCPEVRLVGRQLQRRTENPEGFDEVSTHLIDFQHDGSVEPVERPLLAKLKMFAAVEGYLFKRLFTKPSGTYSNLEGL